MNDRVVVHLDSEGVADVRLNRADKMNAIDSAMIEGILAAQDQLRAEPRLRAVVLHGEGRAFCAGLDISRFRSMGAEENGRGYALASRTHGIANAPQQSAWGWRDLPVPVLAAVHGVAFGGGLQIALGADTVGVGDFDDAYLKELRDLGQPVKEDNEARGYWIGVSIDQMNGTLHGGALRELNSGGIAVGY